MKVGLISEAIFKKQAERYYKITPNYEWKSFYAGFKAGEFAFLIELIEPAIKDLCKKQASQKTTKGER